MEPLPTIRLDDAPRVVAPDGSDVRPLLVAAGGSMARFELAPRRTSVAVRHRSVEEIWFVVGGRGEMWRSRAGTQAVTALESGVCVAIPPATSFQFRSFGPDALVVIAVTMPPWPGEAEAEAVPGAPAWDATPG